MWRVRSERRWGEWPCMTLNDLDVACQVWARVRRASWATICTCIRQTNSSRRRSFSAPTSTGPLTSSTLPRRTSPEPRTSAGAFSTSVEAPRSSFAASCGLATPSSTSQGAAILVPCTTVAGSTTSICRLWWTDVRSVLAGFYVDRRLFEFWSFLFFCCLLDVEILKRWLKCTKYNEKNIKKAGIALPGRDPHLRATGRHLPYGITQCYLPPDTSEHALTPAMQTGTRFTYPRGMEGWVDLVDLIAPRPGVEPATCRSRVRHRTTAPPKTTKYY